MTVTLEPMSRCIALRTETGISLKVLGGATVFNWGGQAGDIPLVGDFDGDVKADFTVRRGNNWMITYSSGGAGASVLFGMASDQAVPADYDGDGKDDIALFRESTGDWTYIASNGGGIVYGSFRCKRRYSRSGRLRRRRQIRSGEFTETELGI